MKKYIIIFLVLIVSILFGDMVRRTYIPTPEIVQSDYQVDTLPLENQGVIQIQKFDGKKTVIISFDDWKYILKHRKSITENLEALFERMN